MQKSYNTRTLRFIYLCCVLILLALYPKVSGAETIVLASNVGAHLDTNLMKGGGTDDTAALQAVLDRAADGTPVHLIIDGAALVSGLNVYGNTTIESIEGGGLYLKDGSARAILRNAHRSRGVVTDEHITVRNCFLNGNRDRNAGVIVHRPDIHYDNDGQQEPDGTFISGLQFLGVNRLTIQNVTLWNTRAFGAFIANAQWVTIRGVVIDDGSPPGSADPSVTDALHFKGPIRYMTIDDLKIHVGDDGIALNANDYETDDVATRNDFGPFVGQGPMTDIAISNVILKDTTTGVRILSANERIDRVVINNVTGTIKDGYLINLSHWVNTKSFGNVGSVVLNNVNVEAARSGARLPAQPRPDKTADPAGYYTYNESNGSDGYLISVNCRVEDLVLSNVLTKATVDHPILYIGPEADVRTLTADLHIVDPDLRGHPVKLAEGAHVEHFNLSLNWHGRTHDEGKPAIAWQGGTVSELNWVATPPTYVKAEMHGDNTVSVTFSEDVKAIDFIAGVGIKVNGAQVEVSRALRQERADVVDYILRSSVQPGDTVTWAYDAGKGTIQNWSGDQMPSISEKKVASR